MSRFSFAVNLLLGLGLLTSVAQAQITLHDVSGTVEQQRGTWQLAKNGDTITQALRTGTGRVTFQNGAAAQVTMGSSSLLQLKQNEPDLQAGRFYMQGDARFYVQGTHYFTSGKVRIDLQGNMQRIAVIAGSLRIANGSQVSTLQSGQQYDLKGQKVSAFSESDPWYLARFAGTGDAQVEAISGDVTIQSGNSSHAVQPVESLQPGQVLSTGDHAWAEVGFTGGGYLRLQAQSALSVLSIEKTSRGREVQLKLLRGSAWNVVSKGQGGYQITTPTITTAVRGTIFRVDSSGQAKVFDGKVAVPSNGNLTLPTGQQLNVGGQVDTLKPDASDLENQALDAAHNAPLQLAWNLPQAARQLDLTVQSQSSSQLTLSITPLTGKQRRSASSKLRLTGDQFHLRRYLPEGLYAVQVQAERFGKRKQLSGQLRIDRQPPQLEVQLERRGKLLHLYGTVSDVSNMTLTASVAAPDHDSGNQGHSYQHHFKAGRQTVDWWLPADKAQEGLLLKASDQAGNITSHTFSTAPGKMTGSETGHASQSRP